LALHRRKEASLKQAGDLYQAGSPEEASLEYEGASTERDRLEQQALGVLEAEEAEMCRRDALVASGVVDEYGRPIK